MRAINRDLHPPILQPKTPNPKLQTQIEGWPTGIFASFVRITEQMQLSGPNLGLPYTKALGEGVGRVFFCCMKGRRIVLLHGFIKKTQNTPLKEIRIARQRMHEVPDEKNT